MLSLPSQVIMFNYRNTLLEENPQIKQIVAK